MTSQYYGAREEVQEKEQFRGMACSPILDIVSGTALRVGSFVKAASLVTGLIVFSVFSSSGGLFTCDNFTIPEDLRYDATFHNWLLLIQFFLLMSVLMLASFQIYLPDNSRLNRGFRSGSKMFSTAVILDIFTIVLRVMQYIYATHFLTQRWWLKYTESTADWCLFHTSGISQALSLLLYGLGIFYVEAYSDVANQEGFAWMSLILFALASFSEFLLILTGFGTWSILLQAAAWISTFMWSLTFEQKIQATAPTFHDRNVCFGLK